MTTIEEELAIIEEKIHEKYFEIEDEKGVDFVFWRLLSDHVILLQEIHDTKISRFYLLVDGVNELPDEFKRVSDDWVSEVMAETTSESQAVWDNIYWLGDDKTFHKVTAPYTPCDVYDDHDEMLYARKLPQLLTWFGDLVANDQVVGSVTYSDI